jgi:hypothetical protein
VICQQNDLENGYYIFLMQLSDGVKIDLYFRDFLEIHEAVQEVSIIKVILGKENVLN